MTNLAPYFEVCRYSVMSERDEHGSRVRAIVEVKVGLYHVRRSSTGAGPVHALDNALRGCLQRDFPELDGIQLSDYRVGMVDATHGTAAQVRVTIEATDGDQTWTAGCVAHNIVDASFEALCSSALIGIMRARSAGPSPVAVPVAR